MEPQQLCRLQDIIPIDEMENILEYFCTASKLSALITDPQGNLLANKKDPLYFTPFCARMRDGQCVHGSHCIHSDALGNEEAIRRGKPYIYRCHAGFVEVTAPIIVNGMCLGAIIMGQVRTDPEEAEKLPRVYDSHIDLDADPELKQLFEESYRNANYVPFEQLDAYAGLMNYIANFIVQTTLNHHMQDQLNASKIRHLEEENRQKELELLTRELTDAVLAADEDTARDLITWTSQNWRDGALSEEEQKERLHVLVTMVSKRLETKTRWPEVVQSFYQDFVLKCWSGVSLEYHFAALTNMLCVCAQALSQEEQTASVHICRAKNWIREHIDQEISLQSLSNAVFLSQSHLSRLFKRYEGISISEYLRRERLELACRMLRGSTDSVDVIALKCGYDKGNSFGKMFKKTLGMTPSQYREQFQSLSGDE